MPKLWPFGKKEEPIWPELEALREEAKIYRPPWGTGMQPDLKKHFALTEALRNAPASRQEATAIELVQMAAQSIRGFRAEYDHRKAIHDYRTRKDPDEEPPMEPFRLPMHLGFQRLAINAEKAKDYGRAIEVCEEAKRQGWNGDWDKRIERCQTKAAKG